MTRPQMVAADQMSAAAGHLARNWGEYGYRIGVEMAGYRSAIFFCTHSDGSEFRFGVDRWGNVIDIPEQYDTLEKACEYYSAEMSKLNA